MTIVVTAIGDAAERDLALAIRQQVFVHEQGVPAALELDAFDRGEGEGRHFLARLGGKALGTGRYRVKGPYLKFERIATLAASRGLGVGAALMRFMQDLGAHEYPRHLQMMHSQASAVSFYERLGWVCVGEPFFEAGIEHRVMTLPPGRAEERSNLLLWDSADDASEALCRALGERPKRG